MALGVSASMMLIIVAEVASCILARLDPTLGWVGARGLAVLGSGGSSRQKARGRMMTGGGLWLGSGEVRDPEDDLLTSWG